jgi:hypothetical protein
VSVFFGYEIGASVAYTNSESSCDAHYMFVIMPLKTKLYCETLYNLFCEIQINAFFGPIDIAISDALLVRLVKFFSNEKFGAVAFACLQYCGFRLELICFEIVGSLFPHYSPSVTYVCSSCDVNPNFLVPCDFVNELLSCVKFGDILIQDFAMIVKFNLCETKKKLKIVMSHNSHVMSFVLKSCIGYHDKLGGAFKHGPIKITEASS